MEQASFCAITIELVNKCFFVYHTIEIYFLKLYYTIKKLLIMPINWEEKIQIDPRWVERQLNHHFEHKDVKLVVRGYTPKISGISFSCESLLAELVLMIPEYANSEARKKRLKIDIEKLYGKENVERYFERSNWQSAQKFFGKKNPQTDGKYGELLLFALVESVLRSKMVAHKIVSLTNYKDQVKGGDGIFLGNYQIDTQVQNPAIFIGESKIMQGFSSAVDHAFDSLDRFHSPQLKTEFNNTEFIVARDTLIVDEDYEELYNRLTPGTSEFREQVIVHPILIMFNTARIKSFEAEALIPSELDKLIKNYMQTELSVFKSKISEKLSSCANLNNVFIDFFIFPFDDIDVFRNGMYYHIHGVSYKLEEDEQEL